MHNSLKTSLLEKNQGNEIISWNLSLLFVAITNERLNVVLTPGFWDLLDDCAMFRKIADLQLFKECSAFLERVSKSLKLGSS